MDFANAVYARTDPIRLDGALIRGCSRQDIERRIRRVVRSVRFEYFEEEGAFRILGPDTSYHAADPHLARTLAQEWGGLAPEGIVSYRTEARRLDLCFEDSWSGWFIAQCLQMSRQRDDLILIHLDDHTDMMPTLLRRSGEGLTDVATDRAFRPAFPGDWEASIRTGAVGIGSFITPIYYSGLKVHVRHLNHFANSAYRLFNVTPLSSAYALIPGMEFAGIRKRNDGWEQSAGTYLGGADAEGVLRAIPDGRVIVHIDLDYFINDFNGNPGTPCTLPDRRKNERARQLMDRFFEVIKPAAARVERWIVATSPGFCSAFHWRWLLKEIEERMDVLL